MQLAKLFKYTNRPQAADATFAVFLVTWIATRHVVFGRIMWSVYFESGRYLPWDWRPRDGYFHSYEMVTIFAVLLTALQVLLCIWTTMSEWLITVCCTGFREAEQRLCLMLFSLARRVEDARRWCISR